MLCDLFPFPPKNTTTTDGDHVRRARPTVNENFGRILSASATMEDGSGQGESQEPDCGGGAWFPDCDPMIMPSTPFIMVLTSPSLGGGLPQPLATRWFHFSRPPSGGV